MRTSEEIISLPNGRVTTPDGDIYYYVHGVLHREDGPAVFINESEHWYYNGVLHNYSGPAVIVRKRALNILTMYWYIHGRAIEGDDYKEWLLDNGINMYDLDSSDKTLISLIWGP